MRDICILVVSLSMLCARASAQQTKDESGVETLRKMLEQQNRVITLMQEIMETRLRKVEALVAQKPSVPISRDTATPKEDWDARIQKLETELRQLREEQQQEVARLEGEQAAAETRVSQDVQKTRDAIAPIAFTPRLTFFGNLMGRLDDRRVISPEGDRIDNTFTYRAGEIEARAAIDPFADAFFTIPFEADSPLGTLDGDVEEGYVELKRLPFLERPPWGLKLKLGKYRPEIGKNNRIHFHDLMWTSRPLPVAKFLGTEGLGEAAEAGFQAAGINAEFMLPIGSANTSLRMQLGAASTGNLAVNQVQGSDGRRPVLYAHPSWFQKISASHSFELGGSYLRGSRAGPRISSDLYVSDFTYTWAPARRGLWKSFTAGGELFYANLKQMNNQKHTPLGYFVFGQYQLGRRWYLGGRFDSSQELLNETVSTRVSASYLSYYTSEFLRFRFGYEHRRSDLQEQNGRNTMFMEMNFVIGAHPPEPYWVRR